jgi:hypothetical protein
MGVADMTEAEFQAYMAQLSQGYEAPATTVDDGVATASSSSWAELMRFAHRGGPTPWAGR